MTPQDITRLLEQTPFVPFRLHLANGQTFEVETPGFRLGVSFAIGASSARP